MNQTNDSEKMQRVETDYYVCMMVQLEDDK